MARSHFVMVDCAADPQYHAALTYHAAQTGTPCRSLFDGQPEAEHAHAGPWLVEQPDEHGAHSLYAWLMLVERIHPCVTRLVTDATFDELFVHLQQLIDLQLESVDLAMCRFWDPRVAWRLQGILRPEQQLAVLGPIVAWEGRVQDQWMRWLRDRVEQRIAHAHEQADQDNEGDDGDPDGTTEPVPYPIPITALQARQLALPNFLDFVPKLAAEIRRDHPQAVAYRSNDELLRETANSYRHASETLGITHLPTLVRWVKANVAWASGLASDPSVDLRVRSADNPSLAAQDVLTVFAGTRHWVYQGGHHG